MTGRWQQTPSSNPHDPAGPEEASALSRALLATIMVTVLYFALLVAVYGAITLFTDTELISAPGTSPLIGPLMVGSACVIVFVSVLLSLRPRGGPLRLPWGRSIVAAVAVYLISPAIGGLVIALDGADIFAALFFFARLVTGPFIIASAVVVIPMVLFARLLESNGNRPR